MFSTSEIKIYSFESLLHYICEHTFQLLFGILESNEDEEIIFQVLDTIKLIIKHLAKDIFRFKDILFPKLMSFFKSSKNKKMTLMVLKNIKIFVLASSS